MAVYCTERVVFGVFTIWKCICGKVYVFIWSTLMNMKKLSKVGNQKKPGEGNDKSLSQCCYKLLGYTHMARSQAPFEGAVDL